MIFLKVWEMQISSIAESGEIAKFDQWTLDPRSSVRVAYSAQ